MFTFNFVLHCESADESSDFEHDRIFCCIQCKSAASPQCESTDERSDDLFVWMILSIWCICAASLLCESENEYSDVQPDWMICYIQNRDVFFSPVWVIIWRFRLAGWLNDFGHLVHLCGFSPVWVSIWEIRCSDRLNDLLHWLHLFDFSPLWILNLAVKDSYWMTKHL